MQSGLPGAVINTSTLQPLHIGSIKVHVPVMLAPMAGYTDAVMRALARRHGCGYAFTEVASAAGLVRGSKPTWHILETFTGEAPVAAHIYGSEPEIIAQAAAMIEETRRFHAIDINCGCPVAKIVAKGAGAALMKKPEKIARIVATVKKAVSLPVTVKTRLGPAPGQTTVHEVAHAVEEAGGAALAVHARFASTGHTGPVDWTALARVKFERAIPIIGNGGVTSASDAVRMLAESGVDGLMIGKAAVGNPWIFSEIRLALEGKTSKPHPAVEHREMIAEHLRMFILHKEKAIKAKRRPRYGAEQEAVLHFRAHLVGYVRGFEGCTWLKRQLQAMRTVSDVLSMVREVVVDPK